MLSHIEAVQLYHFTAVDSCATFYKLLSQAACLAYSRQMLLRRTMSILLSLGCLDALIEDSKIDPRKEMLQYSMRRHSHCAFSFMLFPPQYQ